MPLPEPGAFCVYVPVLREGAIVPEPEAPEVREPPSRRPAPALLTTALPSLAALGFSPPPTSRPLPPAPRQYSGMGRVVRAGMLELIPEFDELEECSPGAHDEIESLDDAAVLEDAAAAD